MEGKRGQYKADINENNLTCEWDWLDPGRGFLRAGGIQRLRVPVVESV